MKKLILLFALLCYFSTNCDAQVRVCGYFDGFWSEWTNIGTAEIKGNYDGFIIYLPQEGPWEYRFKFNIDDMDFPNKKQRKKDIKNNKWYMFSGTVEYYVTYSHPTILQIFRDSKGPKFAPAKLSSGLPAKKVVKKATIKIEAFKDVPKIYNIWFDNVALGISLNNSRFLNVKYK